MSDQPPEYVWAFPDEKPRRSRVVLIVVLVIAAIIVATAVFLAFLRPWETPKPTASASPTLSPSPTSTISASPSPSATPTPSPSPTEAPTPTPAPSVSPPAPADPALPVFRDKVQPLLDDAATGLSFAQDASSDEGVQIADQLRDDAGRMSDTVAPRSIASKWREGVQHYGETLDALRGAFSQGGSTSTALATARAALRDLNELVAD